MKMSFAKILFFLFILSQNFSQAQEGSRLNSLNINPNQISISGISAGAYMASQMGITYSQTFKAWASVAGGPYWCAMGSSSTAQTSCMQNPATINLNQLREKLESNGKQGLIDPLVNLKRQNIYLYASPGDKVVNPGASQKFVELLKNYTPLSQIFFDQSINSAHGFPTLNYGNDCKIGTMPWMLKCNYDLAGKILASAYGELASKSPKANVPEKFSQVEFAGDSNIYSYGWIYIPNACREGGCALHIALHGCQMNPDYIGDKFVVNAGFNEWADSNKIVVLYPQMSKVKNSLACWDWFGESGENYANNKGPQMLAIKKMIDRLLGP